MTWMRNPDSSALVADLLTGSIECTHHALDERARRAAPGHSDRVVEHIRALLVHHRLLPSRDHYLSLFERWLEDKQTAAATPEVWAAAEQFARWHHLRRIRVASNADESSEPSVRWAKQEITETIKFLNWLHETYGRTAATATQLDVDEYLTSGPSTRHAIRTFFVWAQETHLNTAVKIGHRTARTDPRLSEDERMAWIRTLLEEHSTPSVHHRVIGLLLLLYAQPLTRIVTLTLDDIELTSTELRLRFGPTPVPVPAVFANLIYELLEQRPNLQTSGTGNAGNNYLFPSNRAGRHLHSQTAMHHLRAMGLSLLAGRTSALRTLVQRAPAPIVADMIGYSYEVTARHSELAATAYARYAAEVARGKHPAR